jgi:CrcB protein
MFVVGVAGIKRVIIMIKAMLVAGVGGFFGTCARFLVGRLAAHLFASPFPVGTFTVNIVGCFLIGMFMGLSERAHLLSANMALFLLTGFCGGLTTFSTFSADMLQLLQSGQRVHFAIYLMLSILLGIAFVFIGRAVVRPA